MESLGKEEPYNFKSRQLTTEKLQATDTFQKKKKIPWALWLDTPWHSYKFLLGIPETPAVIIAGTFPIVPSRSMLCPFSSCSVPCSYLLPAGSTNREHQQEDVRGREEKKFRKATAPPSGCSIPHYSFVRLPSLQNSLSVRLPVSLSPLPTSLTRGGNSPR